jgi:hypothetical protein
MPCAVFPRTGPASAGAPGSSNAAPAAATGIQDPAHYQLEARRAMLTCVKALFTGIQRV